MELNELREGSDVKLNVYSGEHYHQQTIREREVPGPFYFPPVASLITAGGRLLLALAEKCVTDAGGTYLFCDTDSLCVVADEKGGFSRGGARADLGYVEGADPREFAPIPCLSRDRVIEISKRFASLNPYSFGGTILKVEDVNYIDGDPSKGFRDLYGYAISPKRYCLFEGKQCAVGTNWCTKASDRPGFRSEAKRCLERNSWLGVRHRGCDARGLRRRKWLGRGDPRVGAARNLS